DYGMIPEAYFYRGNIYAEYASREYSFDGKIDFYNKMTACYDSMSLACDSKEVKKKLKSKCDDFQTVVDSIIKGLWGTNYNQGVTIIGRLDEEFKPNVANAADSIELAAAITELNAVADTGKGFFRITAAVNPADGKSLEGLGLLYDRIDNTDSALYYFRQAYAIDSEQVNLVQSIAYSYIQLKDWENSILFFGKLLKLVPDDINTILNTAVCFNNLQMFDSVLAYNHKAISIDSSLASAYYDIGTIWLVNSQDYSDSTKHFRQNENETEATKYQSLQNASLDSSAQYFCKAAELDESDMVALEQCAVVTMILGNYEEAAPKFKKLTEMSPQIIDFWINLGNSYIQLKTFKEAIVPYEKATELDPNDKKLWEVLLSLYDNEKMTDKANEVIEKIKELEG
ncbi:MAG: tetratricopeptide repeat protein, partial [candidate division Zixibacteria bacterium]|nr:tetratricopeptide repeat protein [candidate division Zixibacteria bacterium]